MRQFDEEQQDDIARPLSKVKYYEREAILGSAALFSDESKERRQIELAAAAVVVKGEVLKRQMRSVAERAREYGRSVPQYIKKVFEL